MRVILVVRGERGGMLELFALSRSKVVKEVCTLSSTLSILLFIKEYLHHRGPCFYRLWHDKEEKGEKEGRCTSPGKQATASCRLESPRSTVVLLPG